MNLTWHIAKKDFRRFWIPLAILCAVAALRFGVGISLLSAHQPEPEWFVHMAIYANVIWGTGLFVTYLLVAAVVQEDSVASAAFWQTRPISGLRLLASKGLSLVLMFGILPVLVSIPWWLCCGLGWAEMSGAAAETLAIQLAVVVLALPWAVVTGNYGRFLLWTLVAAVAWVTAALLLLERAIASREFIAPPVVATRLLAIALVAATGCLGAAGHQFVTRRTWRSVALIVATALLMASAGRWWSWDKTNLWAPKAAAPAEFSRDVHISFQNAYAYLESSKPQSFTVASIGLLVDSIPAHYIATPLYSEQNLRWADGTVTRAARFNMWGRAWGSISDAREQLRIVPEGRDPNWMRYSTRRNLIKASAWDPLSGKLYESFSMELSPESMRRLAREKPEYDGTYWFGLSEPQVVGEGEIREGSVFASGSTSTRVAAVGNYEGKHGLWLSLIGRSPEFLWKDFLISMELAPRCLEPAFGVINQKRSYAINCYNDTEAHALIANVGIVLRKEGAREHEHWNATTHRWDDDSGSLEGATLAEVKYSEAQRFSLPLKVDRLTFNGGVAYNGKSAAIGTYTITGEAGKPGTYKLLPGTNLIGALRLAGGVSDKADMTAVVLMRSAPDGTSAQTVVDVEAWLEDKNPPSEIPALQPGDVIDVPAEKPPSKP
jgi:hypothetical protein